MPQSKKVGTVFIDFNYENRNKSQKFLPQNVASVANYDS